MTQETIQEKINQIVAFVAPRKKRLSIIAAIALGIIIVIRICSGFAIVNISVITPQNVKVSDVDISIDGGATVSQLGSPGIKIVPRNTAVITARADDYIKSQSEISIPWYGFANKKIDLLLDKNASKASYLNINNTACSTYSKQLDSLSSYNCKEPVSLSTNKRVVYGFQFISAANTPYMGGIAGFSAATKEHVNGAVLIVSATGQISSYSTPKDLGRADLTKAHIFANTANPEDNRFIIVKKDGTVYLGKPQENTTNVSYTRFAAPKGYIEDQQQTVCRLSVEAAYCYRGLYVIGDGPKKQVSIRETITTVPYNSTDSKVRDIPYSGQVQDGFFVTNTGELYGKYSKKLVRYMEKDEKYTVSTVAGNVDGAAAAQNMYYAQQGGVYKINDNKTAHQVFYSSNIKAVGVYATTDKVFALGTIVNGGSAKHAYALTSENNITPGKRVIDLLPSTTTRLPRVIQQTLIGDKLSLTIAMPISKRSNESVDQGQMQQAKDTIVESLKSMGIDTDKLDITYTY